MSLSSRTRLKLLGINLRCKKLFLHHAFTLILRVACKSSRGNAPSARDFCEKSFSPATKAKGSFRTARECGAQNAENNFPSQALARYNDPRPNVSSLTLCRKIWFFASIG
jgi:hypothetical protein